MRASKSLLAALAVAFVLSAPRAAMADLRIHIDGGGAAPMDSVLRGIGGGFQAGLAIDYEVVDLLSIGVFYAFTDFLRTGVAGPCELPDPRPVFDHGVGARLDLRFVRHRAAGWFGSTQGDLYGEAFLELDIAYHNLGLDHRVGWALGLGYRVQVAGPFGLGPYVRFHHVVAHSPIAGEDAIIHQLFVTFGLTFFFSFDVGGDGDDGGESDDQSDGDGDGDGESEAGEWEEFEAASSAEGY